MSTVRETVEVEVPLHTAYNQWTQFTEFPRFMEGVDQVTQVDDRHNHWSTSIAGVHREFDTEIVDQLPDERIAWRTTSGEVQQQGLGDLPVPGLQPHRGQPGPGLRADRNGGEGRGHDRHARRRIKGDLHRFKDFIEHRGQEEGGWRGRISPG